MDRLTQRIFRAAKAGNVSMTDLARAGGISRQQLYRIRNGERTPSLVVARKLAKAVGLTVTLTA